MPEGLIQKLAIACLVAKIGDNQGITVVAPVDFGQRTRSRAAVETLRQFLKVTKADYVGLKWTAAANHCGGTVTHPADIVSDNEWLEHVPSFRSIGVGPIRVRDGLLRMS